MRKAIHKNNMGALLALLLFAVFAVCILALLLMSADSYQRLTQRDQASYSQRTAAQYLATRVRQADTAGGISVQSFEGQDTLVLTEEINGVPYETRVYCFDGYIRELFTEAGLSWEPDMGEPILPAEELCIYDEGTYLEMELTLDDGAQEALILHLRSRGEGAA